MDENILTILLNNPLTIENIKGELLFLKQLTDQNV